MNPSNALSKTWNPEEIIKMTRMFLEAHGKIKDELLFVCFSDLFLDLKIEICRMCLDYNAVDINVLQNYVLPESELLNFFKVGYRMEQIKKSYNAGVIQSWFLKRYYDPEHRFGKKDWK